jgi:hypothetical protein
MQLFALGGRPSAVPNPQQIPRTGGGNVAFAQVAGGALLVRVSTAGRCVGEHDQLELEALGALDGADFDRVHGHPGVVHERHARDARALQQAQRGLGLPGGVAEDRGVTVAHRGIVGTCSPGVVPQVA